MHIGRTRPRVQREIRPKFRGDIMAGSFSKLPKLVGGFNPFDKYD